jgi:hypothetical protein
MKLSNLPTGVTDWASLPASSQPGASGAATVRGRQLGDVQIRLVAYSAGYEADHWCHKGHILFVSAGSLAIEHRDGRRFELSAGMSYHVADDDPAPHRLTSEVGASAFIVD